MWRQLFHLISLRPVLLSDRVVALNSSAEMGAVPPQVVSGAVDILIFFLFDGTGV
jgi:hypothetical protein